MRLYYVTTIAPLFHARRNVPIQWFVNERAVPAQRPYVELVEGYATGGYHEGAVDELLDAAEAEALVDWLKINRPDYGDATVAEVKLPLPNNCIGIGDIPVGGLTDFLSMKEADGKPVRVPPLGFTVLGYFDLYDLTASATDAPKFLDPFEIDPKERLAATGFTEGISNENDDFPF